MATRKEFSFGSNDGVNRIHCVMWLPETQEVRAVLHIIHGMSERVERYDHFARFMADNGFVVVGDDHLGHGLTAKPDDFGYFAPDGEKVLSRDEHKLRMHMSRQYPDIPYFMLGHSMGSYILRRYITIYGEGLAGCIIVGTGWQSSWQTAGGIMLMAIAKRIFGDRYKNPFLTGLVFGSYNKRIENPKTKSDWMCRDDEVINAFIEDPYCDFDFTVNGFETLLKTVRVACSDEAVTFVPRSLPLFICSGDADPVGQYGEGVMKSYNLYRDAGIEDLKVKIYPDMRHEIINEFGKEEVYDDLLAWLFERM